MARIPPKATVLSFEAGRPIEDASLLESMGLLSLLAGRAMEAGADPSALVAADHDLLMLCDAVAMAKRQDDQNREACRAMPHGSPDSARANEEWTCARRTIRRRTRALCKVPAVTPAGLYAKAVVVAAMGTTAGVVAISLASDLLNSAELRKALWPATEAPRDG